MENRAIHFEACFVRISCPLVRTLWFDGHVLLRYAFYIAEYSPGICYKKCHLVMFVKNQGFLSRSHEYFVTMSDSTIIISRNLMVLVSMLLFFNKFVGNCVILQLPALSRCHRERDTIMRSVDRSCSPSSV
jgi:hypothetical protein